MLNIAGKPSRIGGAAAKFVGCGVFVIGLALALGTGLLGQSIFPGSYVGFAFAIPIGIITLAVALTLWLGGRKLRRSGTKKQRRAQLQTVRALAEHQDGSVTAADVARAISVQPKHADEMLTELAQDPDGDVSLDLDDDGTVRYWFGRDMHDERWRLRTADGRFAAAEEQLAKEAAAEQEALAEEQAAQQAPRRQQRRED